MHPQLFQFGRLVLPTYGFLLALGIILALLICVRTARWLSLNTDKIWSVALVAIVTALVVSKLLAFLLHWPRWTGVLLAAAAAVAYAVRLGLPLRRTADAFAPAFALGSSVVSIGCLEAGCDYGTPTNLPWAVIFRSPAAAAGAPLGIPLHPTQLYESLIQFVLFVLLLWILHRPHSDGEVVGAWFFLGGLASFLLTLVRGDLSGLIPTTQLFAAAMVLAGGFLWWQRPVAHHA